MPTQTTRREPEFIERRELESIGPEETSERDTSARGVEFLRLLWEERKFLFKAAWYGLLGGLLLAFVIPKKYESTARLMPPDNQTSSNLAMLASVAGRASGAGSLGNLAGDLLGMKTSGALFVGVLRSRTVEDRIIERFNLRREYWAWTIEDARETLEDRTRIVEDRKSGIISVTVVDKDPQRAKAMADEYVSLLNRMIAEVNTSAAHRERVFIENRLTVVKKELDEASVEFSQFASRNTTIDIKEQGKAMVEAAATLQGQLIAAQTELQGLRQVYAEGNIRVRSVEARIGELQRQLDKMGGKDVVAGSSDAASAIDANSLYPSIRRLPLLGVKYADLLRRTKVAEVVYELLTQQYELARVQEAKEIPVVKVLDLPVVPEKKSFPPRKFIAISASLLSLTICAVFLLGRKAWEQTNPLDPKARLFADVIEWLGAVLQRLMRVGLRIWSRLPFAKRKVGGEGT